MAEMLVALWLSCCKPHSPGRVNPIFKPKPRYRQPGQQQWHISNYPKTKCPSFVCKPHSGNLASQHMELSLGGLRGFGVVLYSHLTALNCLEVLTWLVVKMSHVIFSSLYHCNNFCHTVLICPRGIFNLSLDSLVQITWQLCWTSKQATVEYQQYHYLPSPCESLSDQWDLD